MEIVEKVRQALERRLGRPDCIRLDDEDGIVGYVVSPTFRQMTFLDRQTLIDEAVRDPASNLDAGELRHVLAIAAMTPEEFSAYSEDN